MLIPWTNTFGNWLIIYINIYKYIIYLRDRKAYFTVPGISVNRGHVAVIFLIFLIGKSYW